MQRFCAKAGSSWERIAVVLSASMYYHHLSFCIIIRRQKLVFTRHWNGYMKTEIFRKYLRANTVFQKSVVGFITFGDPEVICSFTKVMHGFVLILLLFFNEGVCKSNILPSCSITAARLHPAWWRHAQVHLLRGYFQNTHVVPVASI